MTPFLAELIGTGTLVLLGNGVVANVVLTDTKGHNSGWIVITTGWALAVYVGVVIATPYSGAHLNPAVTIAMAMSGKLAWASVITVYHRANAWSDGRGIFGVAHVPGSFQQNFGSLVTTRCIFYTAFNTS